MISFKNFLAEARMAPLYHGTMVGKVNSIFSRGLSPQTLQERRKLLKPEQASMPHIKMKMPYHIEGVSTTRSFTFAKNWGAVVIELDQAALAQRYEIRPIQYFNSPEPGAVNMARYRDSTGIGNEYEEFIITDKSIPVKYIKRIYIPERWTVKNGFVGLSKAMEYILPLQQKYGSTFIRTYDDGNARSFKDSFA